jgi:hypothetical protein
MPGSSEFTQSWQQREDGHPGAMESGAFGKGLKDWKHCHKDRA